MSARNVFDAIDHTKYNVKLGYISRSGGEWVLVESFDDLHGSIFFPLLGQSSIKTPDIEIKIDVIFPILHGKNGEDGTVQGLAKLLHARIVGPSLIAAAVTMNKDMTKRLLRDGGVPVVPWTAWRTSDEMPDFQVIQKQLGADKLFVKPNNAGSSVGVSKVADASEWEPALQMAAEHDDTVLIEKALDVREIELAVLGNETPRVSIPGEILPGEEFYSYDDKYAETATSQTKIPAELDEATSACLQKYALQAYRLVEGHGMARTDFFIDKNDGAIYLNEINAIPGFTDISMYPKLWMHAGKSYGQLVDELISLASE